MKILHIGPDSGTSRHRRRALERLGHEPFAVDPFEPFRDVAWLKSWSFHTGALGLAGMIERHVLKLVCDRTFDLVLIDGGELIGPSLLEALRRRSPFLINFNLDNPFVPRDGYRWRLFHQALPQYNLFVTPRASSAAAALAAGARRVLEVQFAADEVAHTPRTSFTDEAHPRPKDDVVFVGTWMPERGRFLTQLIRLGVPVKVHGPRWHKAPEWGFLSPYTVDRILDDANYAATVKGARIALGLLSEGNQDLHTTRSMEIPAMSVLLCAQRTSDHLALYREDEEAVFWNDAEGCAAKCLELLRDPERIDWIAKAGLNRVRKNASFNEPLMTRILEAAMLS